MTVLWETSGELTAETPIHVGAAADGVLIDSLLVRDGRGRFLIPGTSLAGVIRAALPEAAPSVWGHVTGSSTGTSAVSVFDAWQSQPPRLELRTTTSIDRRTDTAAANHLSSREFLAPGSRFRFRCIVEGPASAAEELEREAVAITALLRGGINVGAAAGTGHGRVVLIDSSLTRKDLNREGLLAALGYSAPTPVDVAATTPGGNLLKASIPVESSGPVYVSDQREGGIVDRLPITTERETQDGRCVHFVIPGTSIRGALRSRAETLARTLTGTPVPEKFLNQVAHSGMAAVDDLFGLAGEGDDDGAATGQRGAIRIAALASRQSIEAAQWGRILVATEESEVAEEVRAINERFHRDGAHLTLATRNSVDRFSGGAADGRLFSSLEPEVTWEPLSIEVDVAHLKRISDDDHGRVDAALALLLFLLIDLSESRIRLGHSTTRGAGEVHADRTKVEFTSTGDAGITGTLADVLADTALLSRLDTAWQSQIDAGSRLESTHV